MDDYFSGLIRPHIDEMKLDEEDWGSDKNENKNKSSESPPITRYGPVTSKEADEKEDQPSAESEAGSSDSFPDDITTVVSKKSSSSSSSSEDEVLLGEGPSTLEDFRVPTINYERDYPTQNLVGVIGREFDEPWIVSSSLQALARGASIDGEPSGYPRIKFVPYTIRRSVLTTGRFDPKDISKHDMICMCYNASEARIMLTGRDGYYSQLLKHVEALLG